MIAQFRTLQTVKRLREDKALRALQQARRAVQAAEERLATARETAEESARTLPAREAAIFAEIMRQLVGVPKIDEAKERVQQLMEAHQRLLDRVTRARDHLKRCEAAAEEARQEHARRRAETEKIDVITEEMVAEAAAEALAKEEAEIEDLFTRPRRLGGLT